MSSGALCVAAALALVVAPGLARAQSLDPADPPPNIAAGGPTVELALGMRAVTSLNGTLDGRDNVVGAFDFSDTYLYLRPRLPLFNKTARAGATFALTFPDVYTEPGTLLLAEMNVFFENRYLSVRLGRGRLRSRVISMPTLRDDDLIRYSDAQNPFSDGRSTADHQFGNTLDLTLWPTPRVYVEVHTENLPNFVLRPDTLGSFNLNSVGLTAGYREIAGLAPIKVLRHAGAGFNFYQVNLPQQRWLWDALAAVWLNVFPDPIHNIDWRFQAHYSQGIDDLPLLTLTDTYRAKALSVVSSLGYTYQRNLVPTFRTAFVGAYKRYVDQSVSQSSFVFNAFYSLGLGVEVGLQYQYQSRSGTIPAAFGDDRVHSLKFALIGTFDGVVNRQFDERDSLLNTEAGYLP